MQDYIQPAEAEGASPQLGLESSNRLGLFFSCVPCCPPVGLDNFVRVGNFDIKWENASVLWTVPVFIQLEFGGKEHPGL